MNDKIIVRGAVHRDLPKIRTAKTFSFTLAGTHGYITVGEYEDGTPGEVFVSIAKQGSTLRGVMDAFAISMSHGLQYGVPLKSYVRSFVSTSFAPAGITDDPEVRTAMSLVDYIARRLAVSYLSFDDRLELGLANIEDMPDQQTSLLGEIAPETPAVVEVPQPLVVSASAVPAAKISSHNSSGYTRNSSTGLTSHSALAVKHHQQDAAAPICYNCGNQTQRAGSCYVCSACGSTSGCS